MWEPQHLTTLRASMACYRDTFTTFTLITKEGTYAENIFIIEILRSERKSGKYFELKLRTMAKILVTARNEEGSTQTTTGCVMGERSG
jgi:hypothetical protein